ncbi:Hypothetical_protein [Hexamita inflata]|uniref:Hypothetical_protein n=1 Tax=Hexamita inflata TaxID=28002 RepID=A0AA86U0X0_9EUKA|nr:Hypothetical protein HINF_LOCUS21932 [Hexamita inflata]
MLQIPEVTQVVNISSNLVSKNSTKHANNQFTQAQLLQLHQNFLFIKHQLLFEPPVSYEGLNLMCDKTYLLTNYSDTYYLFMNKTDKSAIVFLDFNVYEQIVVVEFCSKAVLQKIIQTKQ